MGSSLLVGVLMLLWMSTNSIDVADSQVVCYRMDLAFVVDGSGSICDNDPNFDYDRDTTCSNWNFMVQFIYQIVSNLTIGPTETSVALITFETTATLRWNLTRYTDKASLLAAIQSLPYNKGGRTNTTGALQVLNSQVFNTASDRPGVNNTAIIITDGKPTDPSTVESAIVAVHQSGTRTLVVGVTDLVDEGTLKLLASPPKEANVTYFVAKDYRTIDFVRQQLQARTCEQPTALPSIPSTPTTTQAPTPTTPTTPTMTTQTSSPTIVTQASSPTVTTTRLSTMIQSSVTSGAVACRAMDLAFVVDASGSICDSDPNFNYNRDNTCDNWHFIVQFIRQIVESLTIGPVDTRVALVTFSSGANLRWNLTTYRDKASLLAAIDALPYQKGGTTDTTGGLNLLNTQVFNTPDDRPDINNTAIIITDGKPTNPSTVQAAVDAVHNSGTRTLVVGVTEQVDEITLMKLSSPPMQLGLTYFVAKDFRTIDDVRGQLTTQTCSPGTQASTMQQPSSRTTVPIAASTLPPTLPDIACSTMDLCFLVDASGSICDNDPKFDYTRDQTCDNWASIVRFIGDIVSALTIGPSSVRVALVTFASSSRVAWGLGNYTDKASVLSAINNLAYIKGGRTDTTGGLNLMNAQIFNTADDRPSINNTVIIITDGKPTDSSTVPAAIKAVHDRGIRTLTVGVTNQIDESTLQLLSSPPQQAGITYFMATDFRTLDAVRSRLQTQTCGEDIGLSTNLPSTPSGLVTSCSEVLDVTFVVDGSGSICDNDANFVFSRDYTCQNWNFIVQFIRRIADSFNIGPYSTRVAMVVFASNARLVWGLNAYTDKPSLLYAIESLMYKKGGTTDTTGGLNMVNTQVFNTPGDRLNVANTAIIITDGKPTNPSTVQAAIDAVHASNIRTFAVGVTNQIDEKTLKQLSSPPQQLGVTYFVAKDYSMINDMVSQIASQACNQGSSSTPIPTIPSTPSTPPTTFPSSPTTLAPTTATTTTTMMPLPTGTTRRVCTAMLDLCFVVDRSGSICDSDPAFDYNKHDTCNNWNLTLQFLRSIVQDLTIGPSQIRVGLVLFASSASVAWNLTAYNTKDSLINAINNVPYQKGGTTDTTGALTVTRTQIFGTSADRPDVNNTAIIITDGKPTNSATIPDAIAAVHNAGIRTLVVGVTALVDEPTLKGLSSPPQKNGETYFMATGFDTLETVRSILQTQTCGPQS